MSVRLPIRMSSTLLAVAATLAMAASVARAGEPVAVGASAWTTTGTMKAKVDSLKDELEVEATIEFGPSIDLLSDQFRLTIDDGVEPIEIVGTWDESKLGKPYFHDLEDDVYAALGLLPELEELGIELTSQIKATPKLKDGVETIKIAFKIKVKVSIGIEPFEESMAVGVGYKGEGTRILVE